MGTDLYHIQSFWYADDNALATGSTEDSNHDLRIVYDFCEATGRKTSIKQLLSASFPPGVEATVLTHSSQPEMTSKEYGSLTWYLSRT
jgi:hypothetical protein